ncbi:YdcF family protein [Actinomadura rudentiformis]|uniref:YdcF family protein n=1 Tax=Actinomadura rudentiformis TaxID=359158 RepID=A0A6H9YX08_9ACTN|nr:YdcF family protein [Actinomadura rudentiformis]KAB2345571.1 YdcF family protein [Actinomadura rudentiformis]
MTLEVELPETERPEESEERPDDLPEGARRRREPRPRWLVLTMSVVLGLLAIAVLTPLVVGWRVWYQARQDEHPKSDAIIVLGAAQYNGVPSPTLKWRLQHALNLYRAGVAPRIVTVGGKQPNDNFTEAGSGRRWLIEKGGVPADRVIAVGEGRDTLQSMKAVGREFKRLDLHSGVIVTDPWHGLRSKRMAEDNGIKAAASPTRSGPSVQTRDTQMQYIVRETGGYLSYVLLGKSWKPPSETIKGSTPPDPS